MNDNKTYSSEPKGKEVVEYVKERYKYLYGLKQHRFLKYWKYRAEYSQSESITNTEDGFINYYMNTGFAISNAKVSEISASTPQYDFVGLDENGRKYKKMVQKLWDWIWLSSGSNKAVTQIVRDSCNYGTGFGLERYTKRKRKVKNPTITDEGITFIEEEIIDYEGCELIPLKWENVMINGSDIDDSTEAIVINHWDKDEFYAEFSNKGLFNCSGITPGKMYYTPQGANKFTSMDLTDRSGENSDNNNTISVIEYWNKYKDEYIVIANDVHINPYQGGIMPNPNPHKEIPIVVYVDHRIDGDAYGRGEFDVTEKSRLLKNESRSLMIESIKMQGGIVTIDPASDFDETVERIGLKQFARVRKEDLNFFQPNINVSSLELLEKRLDEDIIVETGVDFRGQLFGPNETAERSKGRIESARKRINSNIRENAYSFFSRLARLRIENIKTYYKGRSDLIPVKGYEISSDGTQASVGSDFGTMELTKGMLSGKILLIPIVDSIAGDTSKIQKQKWLEIFQILINLKKADGSPLIDPAVLVDSGRGIMDDVVDFDKILGGNVGLDDEINKMLAERGLPNPNAPKDVNGQPLPEGVPPAQQSGRPILLPSSATEQQ